MLNRQTKYGIKRHSWMPTFSSVVGHFTNFGAVEADLTYAITNDFYQSFTVGSATADWLDLRGAEFDFTIERLNFHGGRRYAVMSSVDGFNETGVLFDTGRFTTTVPEAFDFTLPFAGFHTDQSIEFRIYVYEGQYGNKDSSLTEFLLRGATSSPDTTAPTVSLLDVADESGDVAVNVDLAVSFNENVQRGAGNILIRRFSDNITVQTIDVQSTDTSVSGSNLLIDLPSYLDAQTDYYAQILPGSILDLAGNAFAGINDNTTWNFLTAAPPTVATVVVNHGDAQRSSLHEVEIAFNEEVEIDFTGADPFRFVNTSTSNAVIDVPLVSVVGNQTIVRFSFDPGTSVSSGGSLLDGAYELTIDATRISRKGLDLDGDDEGNAGGNHVFIDNFYRKYGDQNGSGIVDLLDFAAFRQAFGASETDVNYLSELDGNGNGTIDLLDFAEFRQNFGT